MNRRKLHWIIVLIAAAGCHRSAHTVVTPPTVVPAVALAVPASLRVADSAYGRGDFAAAARSYETYLQPKPQSPEMDRILFQYAVSETRGGHESQGTDIFRQLIREFPDSVFTPPASMAIALRSDIVRLQSDQRSKDEQIRQLTALVPPPPPVLPAALEEAESAYKTGDFAKAARSYEAYLQSKPESSEMDGILFRFAIAQSFSGTPAREMASNETLKQLIKDFSGSSYAASARRIIDFRENLTRSLMAEKSAREERIRQLTEELDKIKKVDVDSGRRRTQ